MTEKEIFELFDLYGTDMGDYYEIEVGRIERLVKEIEFQSAPKELSDEEIGNCVDDYFGLIALQHKYIYDIDQVQEYGLKLAREILRKAQEK